ncbi:aldose epimerase family protein [Peristeroidobacter soli]|uniref:aldose epimerase family protein n=1 Tax=Peristeroidobacter soli TaxID=2497877 RepID=UPI00101C815B|nr:hypothetical protein [Peristeroidobacter soli]
MPGSLVWLSAGRLQAAVVPGVGGSLACVNLWDGSETRPVFRGARTDKIRDPREAALFPMVPWADRIFGGGFNFGDRHWRLSPRSPGPHAHGYGWMCPWSVVGRSAAEVQLAHAWRGEGDDFSYDCVLAYRIESDGIAVEISVRNSGASALPFGLGLHPYVPRFASTRIALAAHSWLPANANGLLQRACSIGTLVDSNRVLRADPAVAVNGVAADWSGNIQVDQPALGLALEFQATGVLARHLHIFAPAGADYICLEPVSHLVNEHSQPSAMIDVLPPGAELRGGWRCIVHDKTMSPKRD